MNINPYSIGPSICGIIIFALGAYVFSKDFKNPLNRSFFYSLICITIWLSFYGIMYNAHLFSDIYYRFSYCFIAFIAISFFNFITLWVQFTWVKYWKIFNHLIGLIECVLIVKTNSIISGTHSYFFGTYPKAGPLHPYFLIYFIFLLSSQIFFLIYHLKTTPSHLRKKQTKLLLLGYSIISLACIDFIPNYGFEIYPPGFICAFIFAVIIAYAIFRHNLLEIKTIISNSIVYSILIAFVFLIGTITVLLLEKYVQNYLGYQSIGISITFAFMIGVLIIPLRNWIQDFIDFNILKGSPVKILEENIILRQELSNADKLRSVAILASSLAHEIKNPITTIHTFADHLPKKNNDPQFLTQCRKTLLQETNRIELLIEQLLSFAKPSLPCFQNVNPQRILEDILLLLENRCLKHNIHIQRTYTAPIEIKADNNQLKQAFLNILLNAIEAMPQQGTLHIQTLAQRHTYMIIISDTGLGISPEDIKNIFDPFFTKKTKGTGLGLSITHDIIKEHGGTIVVESVLGAGSTFRIELPIKADET